MTAVKFIADSARRNALVFVTVIALALIAGGCWYYRLVKDEIFQRRYDEISAIGKLKIKQIQQWRKERELDAIRVAHSALLRKAVGDFVRHPEDTKLRRDLQQRLQLERDAGEYANVLLFALNERLLLVAGDDFHLNDPVHSRAIERAIATREPVFSDFCTNCIDVAAVVSDVDGKPLAVEVLCSDPRSYLYPLIQFWPSRTATAETILVARDDSNAIIVNETRFTTNIVQHLRVSLSKTNVSTAQVALGKQGKFVGRDYRGVEVLADLQTVPQSPWFIVSKMDTKEILAEARYRAGGISLVIGLLILLTASAVAYMYRRRQVVFFKNLYESEQRFSLLFENSPVAIWLEDFTAVIGWMQELRAQRVKDLRVYLDEHPAQLLHALGLIRVLAVNQAAVVQNAAPSKQELIKDLPRLFHESTRRSFTAELDSLWQGQTSFEFESPSVRFDGRPLDMIVHVEVPRKGDAPDYSRVIVTGTDITVRKQVIEALRQSEERYRHLFDRASVGLVLLISDGTIFSANDAYARALGYRPEELQGRKQREVDTPGSAQLFPERFHRLLTGEILTFEVKNFHQDGHAVPFEVSASMISVGGKAYIQSFVRDITERKEA